MNIPQYPDFQPLQKNHLPLLKSALQKYPPLISEFTCANLYCWRSMYNFSLSELYGYIIVKFEKKSNIAFFDPIGGDDKKSVIIKILQESKGNFVCIPEKTSLLFRGDPAYTLEFDRNSSDYLYNMSDLVTLPGRKYDGKRNLIRNFKANYRYDYMELNQSNALLCLDFEEHWCSIKNCDSIEGLNDERKAIREMIANFSDLNLIASAIKIDNNISAVAIAERLNPNMLIMHVLKANPNITGLYQTIMNEFLSRQSKSFDYVNLEEDLGIAGLKKSKLSYYPIGMIQKYTLSIKK